MAHIFPFTDDSQNSVESKEAKRNGKFLFIRNEEFLIDYAINKDCFNGFDLLIELVKSNKGQHIINLPEGINLKDLERFFNHVLRRGDYTDYKMFKRIKKWLGYNCEYNHKRYVYTKNDYLWHSTDIIVISRDMFKMRSYFLKHIKFTNIFNGNLDNNLPPSVKTIYFGRDFNQPFDITLLPNLKKIKIYRDYPYPIEKYCRVFGMDVEIIRYHPYKEDGVHCNGELYSLRYNKNYRDPFFPSFRSFDSSKYGEYDNDSPQLF